jgi:hypothetical protein
MRYHFRLFTICIMIAPLACSFALAEPNLCTQRTVVGTYALAVQGTTLITLPGSAQPVAAPFASLFLASIDSEGVMSSFGYDAFNGQVAQGTAAGTVQVNPDCTAIVKTSTGTTSTDIITDDGDEIWGLMTQFPVGNPLLQGLAKRISHRPIVVGPAHCPASQVRGTYAVKYQGTYLISQPGVGQLVPMPALLIGLLSIDRQGQVSGAGTVSLGGKSVDYDANGSIEVGTDCTAVVQLNVSSAALTDSGKSWMLILEGGDELLAIQTESQAARPVLAGVWKRISR